MSRQRLTVVLSQAQGKDPRKRALEESLAAGLILEPGLDVSIVPYLYDLDANHTGRMYLESISGDVVVLAWMYPRAAFWLLDRDGIKGHYGENSIGPPPDDDDETEASGGRQPADTSAQNPTDPPPSRGIGSIDVPERHIYCLDLRDHADHRVYVDEVLRIAAECRARRDTQAPSSQPALVELGMSATTFAPEQLLQPPSRRWYPVIDYSRCTNCMECLDFCLFGVYGVDSLDRLIVESQDSCKKGCPACSRVCPEQAIIFPDYKTPAIAGAPVGTVAGLKIDLSKLFGGGDGAGLADAMALAASERDRELVAVGREAVGMTVGIPKRQTDKVSGPKDDLDKLMDDLDALEI